MSAGIPTIAGYIWASAADGFRKWRFNGMRVEDGGTTGYADFAWVGGKCAGFSSEPRNPSPQNRRRAVHFRAQVMPEGTKLSCRAPCCGRVDDRKCRV